MTLRQYARLGIEIEYRHSPGYRKKERPSRGVIIKEFQIQRSKRSKIRLRVSDGQSIVEIPIEKVKRFGSQLSVDELMTHENNEVRKLGQQIIDTFSKFKNRKDLPKWLQDTLSAWF